jgi:hypothetical protein
MLHVAFAHWIRCSTGKCPQNAHTRMCDIKHFIKKMRIYTWNRITEQLWCCTLSVFIAYAAPWTNIHKVHQRKHERYHANMCVCMNYMSDVKHFRPRRWSWADSSARTLRIEAFKSAHMSVKRYNVQFWHVWCHFLT